MKSGKDSVKTASFWPSCLVVASLVLPAPYISFAAEDCVWSGRGDGITWGDSANWEGGNVPATTSDKAVIASGASELVVSNDVARNISAIDISGEGTVRIVGEQLAFSARNPAFKSTVPIIVDAPLAFNYSAFDTEAIIVKLVDSVFNQKISLLSPDRVVRFSETYSGTGTARFYGPVDGENAIFGVRITTYFHAPINIKTIDTENTVWRRFFLESSGNKISEGFQLHFTEVQLNVENAFDESTPITFRQGVYKDNSTTTIYNFENGCAQVANYIQSDAPYYNGWKNTDFLNAHFFRHDAHAEGYAECIHVFLSYGTSLARI